MRARVNVWVPSGLKTIMGVGHGSLELETRRSTYYITRLGDNFSTAAEGKRATGFTHIQNRRTGKLQQNPLAYNQERAFDYGSDCAANQDRMGTTFPVGANYRIEIPCKSPTSHLDGKNMWGLNTTAIESWWIDLMNLPVGHPRRNYRAVSKSKNCNAAVVEALRVGGLSVYAKPPKNFVFQGTATLVRWVNAAVQKIELLNGQAELLYNHVGLVQVGLNEMTIPTLAKWKSDSRVSARKTLSFARRKEQVAEIDRLLPIYHRQKANNELNAALETLILIQEQVYSHLITKPNSQRRQPMVNLAITIYYEIGALSTPSILNPSPQTVI